MYPIVNQPRRPPMQIGSRVALTLALAIPAAFAATKVEAQTPARTHLAHVTTSFPNAPDGRGLVVTTAEEVNVAMMHANFAGGDPENLDMMKTHAGHVLHVLVAPEGSQGPGLGWGVKRGAEAIETHITAAASAEGASESLRTHSTHVVATARAVVARAEQGAELARRIQAAQTAAEAAPLVEQLRALALALDTGTDLNGDGRIDLQGEAGMNQLEAHVYLILEGERISRVLQ